ncbi:MAG: type II secretion system protein [Planctomycetota bacterium]|nr:type II secretion system protein [Planctomycetota bacterium]
MSLAQPPRRRLRRSGGYTLLEVIVVVILMSGMSLLLSEALRTTQQTDGFLAASARAAEKGQTTIYSITGLISESRHLYENDATGIAYLEACDLGHLPVAPGARLPVIDEGSELHADAIDTPYAGNMLLFVREVNASTCVADRRRGTERWIDTYRMVAVYPNIVARGLSLGSKQSRDLVIWRSVAYPSYRQILEIGDKKERESVVKDLRDRYGFTYAWDPSEDVEEAFYELRGNGSVSRHPQGRPSIEEDDLLSDGGLLVYGGARLAETSDDSATRRAVLAARTVDDWHPHGFEVKVSGTSGSRKVWLHTVVEAAAPDGRRTAVQAHTTMAHVRDF